MKKLYAIQVDMPHGKRLVGPWYTNKRAAKSWVPFVKAFWGGASARVRTFTRKQAKAIQANGGQL